jgi:hypothetical protein
VRSDCDSKVRAGSRLDLNISVNKLIKMSNFQEAYKYLIERIEEDYDINLSLSEKVALRHNLKYSQRMFNAGNTDREIRGEIVHAGASWLLSYGIEYHILGTFKNYPEFDEYVKIVREKSFLL